MWKSVTNILSETFQAVSVLMGAPDNARDFNKKYNSAERFVNWGQESQNPLDFREALLIIKQAPLETTSPKDKIKILNLKATAFIGILLCKTADIEKFNQKMLNKYDTDEYMNQTLDFISNRMKEIKKIISVAEAGDMEKIKTLLGDKLTLDLKPDEIILDYKKEYELVEENYVMKSSIKENKLNEIKNFKAGLASEITVLQNEVLSILSDMDVTETALSPEEKEIINQIKDQINLNLQATINKLINAGIPLKKNQG